MRREGSRTLTVTASQALNGSVLVGGPVRLHGWSLNSGNPGQGIFVDQSAAAPGAGVTIASTSLGNGTYEITWFLEITGTPGAGDVDNVALFIGATQIGQSVNLGVVGNYGPFTAQAEVTFGPQTLAAKAIGAATAGTTYRVLITAIQETQTSATVFDGNQAVGFVALSQGDTETQWLSDEGVEVATALRLQATVGNIQGVLYYSLVRDIHHVHGHPHHRA